MTTRLLSNRETVIYGQYNNLDYIEASNLLVYKFKKWASEVLGATESEILCSLYYMDDKQCITKYTMEEYYENQIAFNKRLSDSKLQIPVFN